MLKKSLLATVVICSLFTQACTSNTDSDKTDPRLTSNEPKFFTESGAISCAIGAGVFGLTCALVTGKTEECLAAAAVGCIATMGVNYLVNNIRTKYKTQEDQLKALSDAVANDNKTLTNLINQTKEVIKDNETRIAEINKQTKDAKEKEKLLKEEKAEAIANINYLKKELIGLKKKKDTYEQARDELLKNKDTQQQAQLNKDSKEQLKSLDSEIETLTKQITELETTLVAYGNSFDVNAIKTNA